MSFSDFVDRVAEASGASKADVRRVLKAASQEVSACASRGESVRIPGLGTFDQSWSDPRVVRGIRSRRRRLLDGRYRIRFRPASALRDAVRGRSPELMSQDAHQSAWRLADTLLADLEVYGTLRDMKVDAEASDEDIRRQLATAGGADWTAAIETYENKVSSDVRGECDHLALAARHRYA